MARQPRVIIQEEPVSGADLPSNTVIVAQVPVSAVVMAAYQGEAASKSSSSAKIMGERLAACVDYHDPQGLFFGGELRSQLEAILKDNLPTEAAVIKKLKEALSVKIEGINVELSVPQLNRLNLGLRKNQTLEQRITDIVKRAVVSATGAT